MDKPLTAAQLRFVNGAVRRERLFLTLAWVGVAVAAVLAVYYVYRKLLDPSYPIGLRVVVLVLILLNARHNLRQHKYARVLRKLEWGRFPSP